MLSACLLTGCGTAGSVTDLADSSCRSFKPIRGSKSDTEETKRQVIGHNRVFDALCGSTPARMASR